MQCVEQVQGYSVVWLVLGLVHNRRFGFCHGLVFYVASWGGVCSWKTLANAEKVLLGTIFDVVGLVSGFGFLGRGGFGNDFGFFGLVLVDLARPWCVIRTKLDSILMNNFWFKSGCGFGFFFGMGLGLVFLVGLVVRWRS